MPVQSGPSSHSQTPIPECDGYSGIMLHFTVERTILFQPYAPKRFSILKDVYSHNASVLFVFLHKNSLIA